MADNYEVSDVKAKKKQQSAKKILEIAHKRFDLAAEANQEIRKDGFRRFRV